MTTPHMASFQEKKAVQKNKPSRPYTVCDHVLSAWYAHIKKARLSFLILICYRNDTQYSNLPFTLLGCYGEAAHLLEMTLTEYRSFSNCPLFCTLLVYAPSSIVTKQLDGI